MEAILGDLLKQSPSLVGLILAVWFLQRQNDKLMDGIFKEIADLRAEVADLRNQIKELTK